MEEIFIDKWVTKGGEPVKSTGEIVKVTKSDIENAVIPIHRVVFIKSIIKKWKNKTFLRKKLAEE